MKVRYLHCYIRVWYARMFSVPVRYIYIYRYTYIRPCSRKYVIIIIKNVTLGTVQGVGIFFLFYLFIFNVQLSFPSKVNAIFLYTYTMMISKSFDPGTS